MPYNYDKLYGETENALGSPTAQITDFFSNYAPPNGRVLDIGCGQGRDALFIARLGHRVVGVDIAPNGISDLMRAAKAEALEIDGITADILDYRPDGLFDVVLIDRTLHMLPKDARLEALARLLDHVAPQGWVLVADERSNIPDFEALIEAHAGTWTHGLKKGGYLFSQLSQNAEI